MKVYFVKQLRITEGDGEEQDTRLVPMLTAGELVAELGAAFLCAEFGFDGDLRHGSTKPLRRVPQHLPAGGLQRSEQADDCCRGAHGFSHVVSFPVWLVVQAALLMRVGLGAGSADVLCPCSSRQTNGAMTAIRT